MSAGFQFADPEQHTLPYVLRHQAQRLGDAPFLSWCCQTPISYGALDELSNATGAGLRALGVDRGDRVALMLPNCLEFVTLWFGLSKLGAVEVPVNPDLKGRLLEHVIANSGARLVICHASRLANLATARAALSHVAMVVVVGGEREMAHDCGFDRATAYDELIDQPAETIEAPVRFCDPMAILYTSGTTGVAKGVIVSYEHGYVFAERTAHNLGMTEGDAYFSPLPLFHIDAQLFGTYLPMIHGGRATLMERFSASRYWDQIRASDSSVTNMLGAMAHVLWKQPPSASDADHPLRVAQAIPMVRFKAEFEQRFGMTLVTGYGQTETSLVTYDRPGETKEGSCGRVMPGFEVAIVDADDRRLAPAHVGEIVLRSDHPHWITTGYHAMPEATVQTMRNLWFHTGDAGYLDEEGWLYFAGRIKDAIRRRGENVSAEELESVINEHPAIIESAAVAVPSELTEDDIKVFVVARSDTSLTPEQLLSHCEEHLPWFMVPRYVQITTELLPRTPSEKIAKEQLRAQGTGGAWDREAHGYDMRRPPAASERALS